MTMQPLKKEEIDDLLGFVQIGIVMGFFALVVYALGGVQVQKACAAGRHFQVKEKVYKCVAVSLEERLGR